MSVSFIDLPLMGQTLTMTREVEQCWKIFRRAIGVTRVREAAARIAELIKEIMAHCFDGRKSLSRCVLEQLCNELDSLRRGLPEDLVLSAIEF
jgi:ethanolamine ammonia-lyase large subunit